MFFVVVRVSRRHAVIASTLSYPSGLRPALLLGTKKKKRKQTNLEGKTGQNKNGTQKTFVVQLAVAFRPHRTTTVPHMQTRRCSQGAKYKLTTRKNFTSGGVQDVDKAAETHRNKAKMHRVVALNTIAKEERDRLARRAKPHFTEDTSRFPPFSFLLVRQSLYLICKHPVIKRNLME